MEVPGLRQVGEIVEGLGGAGDGPPGEARCWKVSLIKRERFTSKRQRESPSMPAGFRRRCLWTGRTCGRRRLGSATRQRPLSSSRYFRKEKGK